MIEQLRINPRIVVVAVVAVALLAVAVIFVMQWLSATDEQTKLESDLKTAQVRLMQVRQEYDVAQLMAEEAELRSLSEFPSELEVRRLSKFLADGAPRNHVEIAEVTPTSPIGTETIGGRKYPAYATKMTVKGSLTWIISYMRYVENGSFRSARVQGVTLDGAGDSWTGKFTVVVVSQG